MLRPVGFLFLEDLVNVDEHLVVSQNQEADKIDDIWQSLWGLPTVRAATDWALLVKSNCITYAFVKDGHSRAQQVRLLTLTLRSSIESIELDRKLLKTVNCCLRNC